MQYQFSVRSRYVPMNAQVSISGGPLLWTSSSYWEVGVVWSVSRLGRQNCCQPIFMASSPGILFIYHPDTTV